MSGPTALVLPSPSIDTEFAGIVDELTRRGFLAGAVGSALLGLAGCAGADAGSGAAPSPAASDGWSFTDDRGATVRLPQRPTRIAFLTDTVGAALWAAGLRPVAATDSGQGIAAAVGLITGNGVAQVYSSDKGVDLEALTRAEPDLLIDAVQPDGTLQVVSELGQLADLAPIVGLSTYLPVETIAATADRLTSSVGTAPTDAEAKASFEAASGRLSAALRAVPELRVGFVFQIDKSTLGVMNPKTWAVLKTVRALGMNLVPVPDTADNTYSQAISLEKAADVPADLLVWAVADPMPTGRLWEQVPAVRAGQIWQPELTSWYAYSWQNFAVLLDGLADHVASANAGVGPQ